jgi:cysteinyl-tRNA synthetase
MDYSFDGSDANRFTPNHITALKTKPDQKRRRVIAYMSIGEAESYRFYWQPGWTVGNPGFLEEENSDWPGNYKVRYWDAEWQKIIFEYLTRIVQAGFDGVYLDIVDAYEYFEDL